jgi:adenylate kinase family enzyme
VVVGGVSGAGKSTVARELARRLGAPYVELDALYHQPGWVPATDEAFRVAAAAATAGDTWVADGNYSAVRDLLWERATTFVWLDYARWVGTARAIRRTARRVVTRVELWNGNREQWSQVLTRDHPIRYSWRTHPRRRAVYEERAADPRWSHVTVVRLRSPRETAEWLRQALRA